MNEEMAFGLFLTCGLLLALGVLLWVIFGNIDKEEDQAPPTPPPAPIETYGHPIDVVGEIRRGLPKLEHGHLWESWVDVDDKGRWVFTLHLLDVKQDNIPIGVWRVNLVNGNLPYPHGCPSWPLTYEAMGKGKNLPRERLVAPAIDWAKQMHNQVYGSMRNYSTQL